MAPGNAAEVARNPCVAGALAAPPDSNEGFMRRTAGADLNRVPVVTPGPPEEIHTAYTDWRATLSAKPAGEAIPPESQTPPDATCSMHAGRWGMPLGASSDMDGPGADSTGSSVPRLVMSQLHYAGPPMGSVEWAPFARSWTAGLAPTTPAAFYAYQQRCSGMLANNTDSRYAYRNLNRTTAPGRSHAIPIRGTRYTSHVSGPIKQSSIEPGRLTDFYDRNRVAIQLTGKLVSAGQIESLLEQAPEDEHVTVWHPATGRTVAGNAAPYRRNLGSWLEKNPGWVEKSFEEKSSKRRRATRRSRAAMSAFSSLCTADERIRDILKEVDHAVRHAFRERKHIGTCEELAVPGDAMPSFATASYQDPVTTWIMNYVLKEWTSDEVVRLIESTVRCIDEIAQSGNDIDTDDDSCDLTELGERGSVEANDPDGYLSYRKARVQGHSTVDAPLHMRAAHRDVSSGGLMVPMDMDDLQHSPPPLRNETQPVLGSVSGETYTAWRKIFEALSSKHPSSLILRAHMLFAQVLQTAAQRGTLTNPVQSPSPTSSTSLGMTHLDPLNRTLSSSHDSGNGADHVAGFAALGIYGCSPSASPAGGASSSAPAEGPNLSRNFFRDARITVWDPSTGKTISGNAAPCWRNLEIWMKEHPGWCVKHEDELSASRRSKHRRARELGITARQGRLRAPTNHLEIFTLGSPLPSDRRAPDAPANVLGRTANGSVTHSLPDEHDCIESLLLMHSGRLLEPARPEASELRSALIGKPPLPPQTMPILSNPNQSIVSETFEDGTGSN
jgi:hypothetical protein